jgi:hypothetical protein
MGVDLNLVVPNKALKFWGKNSTTAIKLISQRLAALGFTGPLTWGHGTVIPFFLDTSETVRVVLSLSKCGGISDAALFDGVAAIWSKTIHDKTISSDPWSPIGSGYENWHNGYVPCLTYRLSHLKWAEKPSAINPAWAMTSEVTSQPNAAAWLSDFESLLFPFLMGLMSDSDLAQAMSAAIAYVPPTWVKSDGPRFVNIRELLLALQR